MNLGSNTDDYHVKPEAVIPWSVTKLTCFGNFLPKLGHKNHSSVDTLPKVLEVLALRNALTDRLSAPRVCQRTRFNS